MYAPPPAPQQLGSGIATTAYDDAGNRTRLADATGVSTTTYDAKRRPTRFINPDNKRSTYSYDLIDRRRSLIAPDGGRFTYSYDAKDRLTVLVNPQSKRTSFSYDALDRLTQQRHGNGSLTTHVYDPAHQLTRLVNATSSGTLVNRFTYSYDNVGNRTRVVESNGDRTTWTYDKAYQLKRERRSGATSFDVTYTYDPAGNRLVQIDSAVRTTYNYDAANQLSTERTGTARTTYTHDASGNRTKKDAPSAITLYTWNEDNRLTQAVPPASTVTLTYNADGRRVKKTVGAQVRKFVYDFEKVLQETNGSDVTTKEYTATTDQYGDLVSAYGGGQSTYHEYDGLGSTDALVNDLEVAADRYTYRAFGQQAPAGSTASDFTFVGRQGYFRDQEVDLYFVRARYYDFAAGRWVSEDPLGYWAGDVNLYRYVGNNPVNATDPSGLQSSFQDLKTGAQALKPDEASNQLGAVHARITEVRAKRAASILGEVREDQRTLQVVEGRIARESDPDRLRRYKKYEEDLLNAIKAWERELPKLDAEAQFVQTVVKRYSNDIDKYRFHHIIATRFLRDIYVWFSRKRDDYTDKLQTFFKCYSTDNLLEVAKAVREVFLNNGRVRAFLGSNLFNIDSIDPFKDSEDPLKIHGLTEGDVQRHILAELTRREKHGHKEELPKECYRKEEACPEPRASSQELWPSLEAGASTKCDPNLPRRFADISNVPVDKRQPGKYFLFPDIWSIIGCGRELAQIGGFVINDISYAATKQFRDLLERVNLFVDELLEALKELGDVHQLLTQLLSTGDRIVANFIKGAAQGFENFVGKIGTHFKRGLLKWLDLPEALVNLNPTNFGLKDFASLLLKLIGYTWDDLLALVQDAFRPVNVALIVNVLETIAQVVDPDNPEGVVEWVQGIIQSAQEGVEGLDDLWEEILKDSKKVILETATQAIVENLVPLVFPAGAVGKFLLTLYKAVKWFLNPKNQDLVKEVWGIAKGVFKDAANLVPPEELAKKVDDLLASVIAPALSGLAAVFELGSIPEKIKAVLQRIREAAQKPAKAVIQIAAEAFKRILEPILTRLGLGQSPILMLVQSEDKKVTAWVEEEGLTGVAIFVASSPKKRRQNEKLERSAEQVRALAKKRKPTNQELAQKKLELAKTREGLKEEVTKAQRGKECGDVDEYVVVGYRPTHPPCQNHHGILNVWAAANVTRYVSNSDDSPTVTLSAEHHNETRGAFNRWRYRRTGSVTGSVNWSQVSSREIVELAEQMFDAAAVPQSTRQQYYATFNTKYHTTYRP